QQPSATRNPRRHAMYGEFCWGITASDGPGARRWRGAGESPYFDYVARGIPDGPDDGTLAPWGGVASVPFAPESVPTDHEHAFGWVSPYHFGINEGPTVAMVENHRSGLTWRLMHSCAPLVA